VSEVDFRIATGSDVETLIVFMREFYSLEHIAFDERAARGALRQILGDDRLGRVWMINDAGKSVGYVVLTFGFSLEFHGRDAFIDELYVEASSRGRGIGRKVLEFLEAACRSLDVEALHLEVGKENTNALRLYRKFGFEDHDRHLMTRWISR
jgi:diamine N-acetyltransferase